jgi:hypothetical protein
MEMESKMGKKSRRNERVRRKIAKRGITRHRTYEELKRLYAKHMIMYEKTTTNSF